MLDKDGKGKLRLTPGRQQDAAQGADGSLRQPPQGQREGHEKITPGLGGERIEGTKPYQYGDPVSELDLHQTLHNALTRHGLPQPFRVAKIENRKFIRFDEQGLRAAPARRRDELLDRRAAGHVRLDDALRRFLAAKKVAMAMQALVRSGSRRTRSTSSASIPAPIAIPEVACR
jgi:Ca-activated chloride channel family protein